MLLSAGTDVVVIFNIDANLWVEYIKNHLQKVDPGKDEMTISVYEDTDLFPLPHPTTKQTVDGARVVIVIASPGFLSRLQCDEKRGCIVSNPCNAIMFLCGVTEGDIKKSGLNARFNNFGSWTKITHDQPEELFRRITANIDDEDEDIPEAEVGCGGRVSSTPAPSSVDAKWAFDITPTVIHSEVRQEINTVCVCVCVHACMCAVCVHACVRACMCVHVCRRFIQRPVI